MRGEHFYGHLTEKKARTRGQHPAERRGLDTTGHILKLFIGQGHGFIRAAVGHDVYFHRSDVQAGASINDFAIGDAVAFELFSDNVSGPRALRVRRR
jgi:cold shock CspA family protein